MEPVTLLGGRYRLVERLGGDGMSVVWRAYDEVLGRQVAVKMVATRHATEPASRVWMHSEAQAAARLTHPHITGVHDYGESPDGAGGSTPYVVMELVNGPTLAERLKSGPLPVQTSLLICAQVAAALAAAHARGLVHRDIKPANVMLSPSGAKVVDFGIAAIAGDADAANGKLWGTPAYLAPERLAGGEVVPASDVYALGLLLYRLLAGTLPWPGRTVTEMIEAHRYVEPAPLPDVAGLPPEVSALCRRCLSKTPGERPTAAEAARAVAAAAGWPVTADDGSGDLVVGAGIPLAGIAAAEAGAAGDDAETRVVPLAAVAAGTPGRDGTGAGRRRRRAVTAAACVVVLLGLSLLGGYCSTGDGARRHTGPGALAPAPSASASSLPASASPGAQPGAGASGATSAATVGSAAGGGAGAGTGSGGGTGGSTRGGGSAGTGAGGTGAGGTGSGGSGGRSGSTPPASGPTPVERSVDTPGGSATCRCNGSSATLTSYRGLPGFTPTNVTRGPAPTVGVTFHSALTDVRVNFTCVNGAPVPSVG